MKNCVDRVNKNKYAKSGKDKYRSGGSRAHAYAVVRTVIMGSGLTIALSMR
jgi:hypothetical protein